MSALPLLGRRVLVTRALHQAGKLSEGLHALGAEPVEVAVLEIRAPERFDPLDAALRRLDSYDWLILTSANAVRALAERAAALEIALAQPVRLKVAAIGEATAAAARLIGLPVDFVPEAYVAEKLVEGLLARAAGQRILLARAAVARDVIPGALRAAGAEVDVVEAYRNARRRAGAASPSTGEGNRRRYLHQFLQRNAPGRSGACGWGCVAAGGRSGDFDWADYQPDPA
jgi:uroporphyrinogen-III synthase/uroporphyrinogen III methyltransferase/synthase